ncbi:hypothetical protein ANCCAN_08518 [Ancylostoma caninum]|uniref:Uncharacterized protein n=1 Tax=Ancylostoma caninum TaxID=29170 RepID=A0A368GM39_ANCCA|nr:hypothetical protein ANCCAN_08518 [Ancylostoma caninum]
MLVAAAAHGSSSRDASSERSPRQRTTARLSLQSSLSRHRISSHKLDSSWIPSIVLDVEQVAPS